MQEVKYQKGVGLLDILVALLLLAIAVLGFVALQLRAVEATAEGANRIQAMNIARDLAEKMRINSSAAAILAYQTNLASATSQASTPATNCYTAFCAPTAKAAFDLHEAYEQANSIGMVLNMLTCPGTANSRQCVYVAWGKTDPTNSTATTSGHIACTNSTTSSFSYNDGSTCVVMEAY